MPLRARRAAEIPLRYNAVEILERNLEVHPGKVALLSTRRTMTFAEVAAEVNRVGNALKALDVRVGDRVGILAADCTEWATSFFGVLKAGGVAVCMNTLLKRHEHEFILNDSRTRVLITDSHHEPLAKELLPRADSVEHVIVIDGDDREHPSFNSWIREAGGELMAADTQRNEPGTLNYSSGTTGEPKGILHAHKDYPLTAQLWGVDVLGLSENDTTFSNARLFFVYGLGGNLFFPWYVGAAAVLNAGSARDAAGVLDILEQFRPTVFYNVPTGYAALLAEPDFEQRDLSSLRVCVSAGEALPAPLWQRWHDRTGVEIIDGLGSTENFHIFLSNRPGDVRPGSSGKPVPGYELRIVNDDGVKVPQGEIGRLQLKGETTTLGYLNQYERTKEVFQGQWVDTGDKYRIDEDGYYWHAGRSDDMLKVGGIWVSPVEVESALVSHPDVLECAVIGAQDDAGLIKPKAFVVLADGKKESQELEQILISHCAERMAAYKRPRWVVFLRELPKTATGKIQRYKLRAGHFD